MIESLCAASLSLSAICIWKLFVYRQAIIKLQGEMTAMLDEMTRPPKLRVVRPHEYDVQAG